jgi:hypothetical protein
VNKIIYLLFQVKLTPEELAAIIEQTGGALKVIHAMFSELVFILIINSHYIKPVA